MKPPACQFYWDDFISGTMHFTDAEVGLYIRLLAAQWNTGSLPDDETELRSYSKGRTPLNRILSKFEKGEDGRLRQPRMESERAKQEAFRKERAESGRRGADKKWHGSANGSAIKEPMAQGMAKDGSPSPSPSPSPICSSTKNKRTRKVALTDEEWISGVEKMEGFAGINVRHELAKAQLWCSTHKRQCTQRFFTNWLGRCHASEKVIGNVPEQKLEWGTKAYHDRYGSGF